MKVKMWLFAMSGGLLIGTLGQMMQLGTVVTGIAAFIWGVYVGIVSLNKEEKKD